MLKSKKCKKRSAAFQSPSDFIVEQIWIIQTKIVSFIINVFIYPLYNIGTSFLGLLIQQFQEVL